jgi:hypothetical protein
LSKHSNGSNSYGIWVALYMAMMITVRHRPITATLTAIASLALLAACGASKSGVFIPDTQELSSVAGVTDGSISGAIDSSRFNKWTNVNKIYIFEGSVAPDELDGQGVEPVKIVDAVATDNSCKSSYAVGGLNGGTYTVAFKALSFITLGQVTITAQSPARTLNLNAARVLKVGPTRSYRKPSDVAALVQPGDVVEIDAGEYLNDVTNWQTSNLTIRGIGGGAHMRMDRPIASTENDLGIWTFTGDGIRVENMEFSGAIVTTTNQGAGVYLHSGSGDLLVCNSYFHESEAGVSAPGAGQVIIEYSEFDVIGNGVGTSHPVYINGSSFTFRHNYVHRLAEGHLVKSAGRLNYILFNRLMDEDIGFGSHSVDLQGGGVAYVVGNLIQKGLNTSNNYFISYHDNGGGAGTPLLYVIHNTIVAEFSGTGWADIGGVTDFAFINNFLVGTGGLPAGQHAGNVQTLTPDFVNRASLDYHLASTSPAINASATVTNLPLFNGAPLFEYLTDAKKKGRVAVDQADVGAFEFNP